MATTYALSTDEKEAIKNILNAFTKYDPNKAVFVKSVLDTPYGITTVRSSDEMEKNVAPEFLSYISNSKFKNDDCVFIKNTYTVNGETEVVNYTIEIKVPSKSNTKSSVSSVDGTVDGEDTVAEASDVEVTVSDNAAEAVVESDEALAVGDVVAAVSSGDAAEAVVVAQ